MVLLVSFIANIVQFIANIVQVIIQVLCPSRKGELGTASFNKKLQKIRRNVVSINE